MAERLGSLVEPTLPVMPEAMGTRRDACLLSNRSRKSEVDASAASEETPCWRCVENDSISNLAVAHSTAKRVPTDRERSVFMKLHWSKATGRANLNPRHGSPTLSFGVLFTEGSSPCPRDGPASTECAARCHSEEALTARPSPTVSCSESRWRGGSPGLSRDEDRGSASRTPRRDPVR